MQSLDAFGRPVQEFQVKTTTGGYLSVCSLCVIAILFVQELQYFLSIDEKDEMVVDLNQDEKYLNISLDITFPNAPCAVLQMNMLDPKKSNVMHIVHHIYKTRLQPKTRVPIGLPVRDGLANVAANAYDIHQIMETGGHQKKKKHASQHLRCGSCFQSHVDEDDCCSTCEDVEKAFKERGLEIPSDYIFEQCMEKEYMTHIPVKGEGCRIDATLLVKKVASTIHLGVGRGTNMKLVYFDDEKEKEKEPADKDFSRFIGELDFTHEFAKFSFGPDFPGLVPVFDGKNKSFHTLKSSEHFQYDIHVIPTRYKEEGEDEIISHQHSMTEYVKAIHPLSSANNLAAGLWMNYDFTPFEVKVTRSRKSFAHFFTECCAILGGIFAFTGMLDNFAYSFNKMCARRQKKGGKSLEMASM